MLQQGHAGEKRAVEVAAEKVVESVQGPVSLEGPKHFQHLGMTGSVHLLVHLGRHDELQLLLHPLEHHGSEVRTCHLLVHFPSSGLPAGLLDASWAVHTD